MTLHRLEFRAMGCEIFAAVDGKHQPSLLSKVPEWFEEWEQALSRFRYDSELTRLNQIHGHPVYVSETLWDVFQTARTAGQMTDGLVTPTLLDAIIEAGYDRPFDVLTHQTTSAPDPVITISQPLTAISFNEAARTITLPPGMGLDFGGVAKGWAAHQAMKRLQLDGPALVDAAGDIAISGPRAGGIPWQIGVDLHGSTRQEALRAVERLIRQAQEENANCLRVVHGKGHGSDGVTIKAELNHWLRRHEQVLAFCSALPADGGAGALYVLLRRRRD